MDRYKNDKFGVIGIDFGDNDFYNTFIPCLEILAKCLIEGNIQKESITKENICQFLNRISGTIYWAHQQKMQPEPFWDDTTIKYIQLEPEQILLGEEVDKYMVDEKNFANSEFFYIYEWEEKAGAW